MAKNTVFDSGLKQFATERQLEYLEAIEQHGSLGEAAKALGVAKTTVGRALESVKRKAVLQNYSPENDMVNVIPEPLITAGNSMFYKNGVLKHMWVKSKLSDQKYQEMMKHAIHEFIHTEVIPLHPSPPPLEVQTDIIPWVQIGDAHLGMLAHAAEVGENFDLKIGERELCTAIGILIDELPPSERIVINDLGDFTHYENFQGMTEASGHVLDLDTRFPKMVRVYSRVFRFIIEKALTKAKFVDVIINQGNYSRTNDIWMAELLRVAYGHTERVNVLDNDNVFIAYRMGNTLVMTHHSDKCKPSMLANVMTTDFRADFGETEHHYIDIGHIHHGMVMKEHPSIFIESFNHLASLDRWAHDSGYRNRKSITVVMRSKTYGEISRRLLPIQEVRDKIAALTGLSVEKFNRGIFIV